MEIDFFFPALNLGFEFQGDHHYKPTEYCSDHVSVRNRDWDKKRICRSHGISLKRVDAIDLEYTRLANMLKYSFVTLETRKIKREVKKRVICHRKTLQRINQDASTYRKTLRDKWDSISARRRGGAPRRELMHALYKSGPLDP